MNDLVYQGVTIREDAERLNLTDMWKASGSPRNARPADWLRLPTTRRLLAFLAEDLEVEESHLCETRRGRDVGGGATWAHWKIGLAYAADLSPSFKSWSLEVVRAHMQGKLAGRELVQAGEEIRLIRAETAALKAEVVDLKNAHALGSGFISNQQVRIVASAKRRVAVKLVAAGWATSAASANATLQNQIRMTVGWFGNGQRTELLPVDLYTRVLALLEGEERRVEKYLKRRQAEMFANRIPEETH